MQSVVKEPEFNSDIFAPESIYALPNHQDKSVSWSEIQGFGQGCGKVSISHTIIINKHGKKGLTQKVLFEQRFEGGKEASHRDIWGNRNLGRNKY